MMYGTDWLGGGGYPLRQWVTDSITTTKRLPMWAPFASSGLPTVAAPYGDVISIWALVRLFVPTHVVWSCIFIIGVWLAGLGMYLFLQNIGLKRWVSFLGGLTYMFSGSIISLTFAGHESKVMGAALFPFILLFFHKGLVTHRFPYFVFAGVITGFSFLNAHFQLAYYALVVCGFYLAVQIVWQRRKNTLRKSLKLVLFSLVALVVMFGIMAISYLPIYGYLPYGTRGETRGYEFATSWSTPPRELLDLVTPYFSGLLNDYWGENYFKLHTEYLGLLSLILAGIAVGYRLRDKYTRFLLALGVGAVLIALGGHTPFYRIPYHLLPMMKKFRASAMAFYLISFSLSALAAIGLEALSEGKTRCKSLGRGLTAVAVALGLFLVVSVMAKTSFISSLTEHFRPVLTAKYGESMAQQKLSKLVSNYPSFTFGLGKALVLAIIYGLLTWILAARKIGLNRFLLLVVPVFLFDVWSVDKHFLKSVAHPSRYYAADEVVNFLRKDTNHYRVFPLYYERSDDGLLTLHGIQSVGGNTGNPLGRYQEFIGAGQSVMFHAPNLYYENPLNLLNVKYVITIPLPEDVSRYDERSKTVLADLREFVSQPQFQVVFRGRRYAIYENKNRLPRAFLVPTHEVIPEDSLILARLKEEEFDPREVVILEEEPGVPSPSTDSVAGEVGIVEYDPNRISVEAELAQPAWLVLSENHYPCWEAWVDGRRTKVFRAYYTLRAVWLDKGRHTVEFVYESNYFKAGATISFLVSLFLLGTVVYWFRRR